ncbi:type 1 glutamine amidotransferase domain-containing protein [Pontibacter silvestris]|uniref:Type 1 glutamine amidotransferase domain-containing protein n=1 Tax=Pontibacter silvestris TaxID=2305183 RepID=A0ABW4WU48_9BACT|nr:type 1 glutamine amidotransferase domain-containing protein [Pontibacter silvestris]MCC9138756.1 type 1 glutamine amidotransferase [Pontibacter silvestris]
MGNKLEGKKIAILVEEGFEQVELTKPLQALKDEGAEAHIISPNDKDEIKAWNHTEWGDKFKVDRKLSDVNADEYNGLLLPGGVMNPDNLRTNQEAVSFVNKFMESGKPVAAICHAPWTLIETGKVKGKKMTSYHTLKTDLQNAGAEWVDQEVVVDNGLVTSRNPGDIPAFNKKMVEEFAEGKHNR